MQASYQNVVSAEMELLKQHAKVLWLQHNDTNSTYFHSRVNERYSNHKVTVVYNMQDELLVEGNQIQAEFFNYDSIIGTTRDVQPV